MYKSSEHLFLYVVILLISFRGMGQALDFRYHQFDTDDGLPSSEIYDLYEDSTGNIWLATDRGVVKYDGYDFITYDTKDGLANLVNFNFQPIGDGTFWVNGLDGSFSFWNGNVFVPFTYNTAIKGLRYNERSWFDFLGIQDGNLFFQLVYSGREEIVLPIYSVNVL